MKCVCVCVCLFGLCSTKSKIQQSNFAFSYILEEQQKQISSSALVLPFTICCPYYTHTHTKNQLWLFKWFSEVMSGHCLCIGGSQISVLCNRREHTHRVTVGSMAESNGPRLHSCMEVCVDSCVAALRGCLGSQPANPNTEGSGPRCICLTAR